MENETKIYDDAEDYSLWTMAKDFYNRKMLSVIILVWAWAVVIIAAAVWSGIGFFQAEDTKVVIMYAVIFLCCVVWLNLMKIFAWQMIHRNGIIRRIKKLQTQIAELSEKIKDN